MKTKTLIPFLALTFGLTWGIAVLLIFFTDQVVAIFGEISSSNPFYILEVFAVGDGRRPPITHKDKPNSQLLSNNP